METFLAHDDDDILTGLTHIETSPNYPRQNDTILVLASWFRVEDREVPCSRHS